MKKILGVLVSSLLAIVVCSTSFAADEEKAPPPPPPGAVGSVLPSGISLTEVRTDKEVDIAGEIDRKAVIFLFSTTCSACAAEMNDLRGMAKFFKDSVQMLAICIDSNPERLKKNSDLMGIEEFRYFSDPTYKFGNEVGISFAPATLIIDSNQKVVARVNGYKPGHDDIIKKALDKAK